MTDHLISRLTFHRDIHEKTREKMQQVVNPILMSVLPYKSVQYRPWMASFPIITIHLPSTERSRWFVVDKRDFPRLSNWPSGRPSPCFWSLYSVWIGSVRFDHSQRHPASFCPFLTKMNKWILALLTLDHSYTQSSSRWSSINVKQLSCYCLTWHLLLMLRHEKDVVVTTANRDLARKSFDRL